MEIKTNVVDSNISEIDKAANQVLITDFESITDYKPVVMHPQLNKKELLHRGTINSIIGKAGSRKTTFISGLVAQTSHKYKILWIDTEQTDQDIKYTHRKLKRQNANLKNIVFAGFIRNETKITSLELLENLFLKFEPDLIIIDNITDFDDKAIMEIDIAVRLIRKLSQFAKKNDSCILSVVHQNESKTAESKGRGHIGSEFLRKSHVVMSVTLDPDDNVTSKVEFQKNRVTYINDFTFEVDPNNTPIFNEYTSENTQQKPLF